MKPHFDLYTSAIRPLLFSGLKADPEWLHSQSMQILNLLNEQGHRFPIQQLRHQLHQSFCFSHPILEQTLWGCPFQNPIGLAAGFDKDGIAAHIWSDFGFGFAELGTVTLHPQPGNPKPRLFRLLEDQAVLNRMGFNNQGAEALAERLMGRVEVRSQKSESEENQSPTNESPHSSLLTPHSSLLTPHSPLPTPHSPLPTPHSPIPLGINLGKSKITPLESAVEDYLGSFRLLKDLGDYFVVNVSSPNTPGLRSLQATEQLAPILAALQQENQGRKPILVKIAPDLEWEDITSILELAQDHQLAGIIATNTTIRRDQLKTQVIAATGNPVTEEAGGISGQPLRARSTEVIRFIYQQTGGTLPIIGVGGVFTVEDAWEKITAGATLVQTYTGWIYEVTLDGTANLKRIGAEVGGAGNEDDRGGGGKWGINLNLVARYECFYSDIEKILRVLTRIWLRV
ncbi:dihydroorotate dehydrogenase (quinone) [Egbenema bharatensis]|uniref:dihydroorotate dehydrogenase (quinone) n=1 Tax=Egbenema bharatensis TaxID=3463334 RepID=UPI003A8696BE